MDVDDDQRDVLFEDNFEIREKDPDGKKFDKVSRFVCESELYDMKLVIDINIDIYPLNVGEHFALVLASSLNLQPKHKLGLGDTQTGTLMDQFEYVMHGRIFQVEEGAESTKNLEQKLYVSFGGLLLQLAGDPKPLEKCKQDTDVFLLVRKVVTRDADI